MGNDFIISCVDFIISFPSAGTTKNLWSLVWCFLEDRAMGITAESIEGSGKEAL